MAKGPNALTQTFLAQQWWSKLAYGKISPTPELPRELHLAFLIMCPANTLCTSNEIIIVLDVQVSST
jgi:hypothetical protein